MMEVTKMVEVTMMMTRWTSSLRVLSSWLPSEEATPHNGPTLSDLRTGYDPISQKLEILVATKIQLESDCQTQVYSPACAGRVFTSPCTKSLFSELQCAVCHPLPDKGDRRTKPGSGGDGSAMQDGGTRRLRRTEQQTRFQCKISLDKNIQTY